MGGKHANEKKSSKKNESQIQGHKDSIDENESNEKFEIKVELDQKEKQSVMEAKLFQRQAQQNFEDTKYPEALSLAQKSLSVRLEKLGGSYDSETAQIINLIGEIYQKQGKHQEALTEFLKVKQILGLIDKSKQGNGMTLLPVLINIAGQYRRLKKYKEALRNIKTRLNIQQEAQKNKTVQINNDFKTELGLTYNSFGNIYLDSKQYQEAIIHYKKALDIFQEHSNTQQVAVVNNNLSEASKLSGNLEEALTYAQIALKIKQESIKKDDPKYPSLAVNYYNFGLLLTDLGRYEEGITNFDKAIEVCDSQRYGADKSIKKMAEEEKIKCQTKKLNK